uniref:Uncharacterized protein n=1 Tax=Populus trichocarpa TaxID=3694 RepID=A9P9A6_POPTR|nr:unknown [Populus trichocarpa]
MSSELVFVAALSKLTTSSESRDARIVPFLRWTKIMGVSLIAQLLTLPGRLIILLSLPFLLSQQQFLLPIIIFLYFFNFFSSHPISCLTFSNIIAG